MNYQTILRDNTIYQAFGVTGRQNDRRGSRSLADYGNGCVRDEQILSNGKKSLYPHGNHYDVLLRGDDSDVLGDQIPRTG